MFLWIILPFIIIHSIIPHKEERFLFPIINFVPIILVLAYQELKKVKSYITLVERYKLQDFYLRLILGFFLIANAIGLLAMASKSAGVGRMEITKFIHKKYGEKPIRLIYFDWSNPYDPWHGLPAKFYQEKDIQEIRINSFCSINDSLVKNGKINLLVTRKGEIKKEKCLNKLKKSNYVKEMQSIPHWMEYLNEHLKLINDHDILILYKNNNNFNSD